MTLKAVIIRAEGWRKGNGRCRCHRNCGQSPLSFCSPVEIPFLIVILIATYANVCLIFLSLISESVESVCEYRHTIHMDIIVVTTNWCVCLLS